MGRPTDTARNAEIRRLREAGQPIEAIARAFDLSLERARQIVRRNHRKQENPSVPEHAGGSSNKGGRLREV
jgi:hypothetical protein